MVKTDISREFFFLRLQRDLPTDRSFCFGGIRRRNGKNWFEVEMLQQRQRQRRRRRRRQRRQQRRRQRRQQLRQERKHL